jgi:hypothetical protein
VRLFATPRPDCHAAVLADRDPAGLLVETFPCGPPPVAGDAVDDQQPAASWSGTPRGAAPCWTVLT